MSILQTALPAAISRCHGYEVEADDGPAGIVETPLFPPESDEPDYLLIGVRVSRRLFPRFSVVPSFLVTEIDHESRQVRLAVRRTDIERLPEQLPAF